MVPVTTRLRSEQTEPSVQEAGAQQPVPYDARQAVNSRCAGLSRVPAGHVEEGTARQGDGRGSFARDTGPPPGDGSNPVSGASASGAEG